MSSVSAIIARPHPKPDVVVEDLEDRLEDVDQRLKDVGERRLHWLGSCGASRGGAQRRLVPVVVGEGVRAGAEASQRWEGSSRGTRSSTVCVWLRAAPALLVR